MGNREYRILASVFNVLLEFLSISAAYFPLMMNFCFKSDNKSLLYFLSISIIEPVLLVDIVYMFLQCALDQLGAEPLSIMYGYLSGGFLILAAILAFVSLMTKCEFVFLYAVSSGVFALFSAIIHIITGIIGNKELSAVEKAWPIRRGR